MEAIQQGVAKGVDMLPTYGAKSKVDVFTGWPIKIMMLIAVIESVLALGTWSRFGWTVMFQLVIVVLGLWMNRNGNESHVWIAVLASLAVGPLVHRWKDGVWGW
ncbi:MAG: hypothetical protein P4L69_05065 [Desulfosporosinus sp.]|nr:hypothetical protein [Desulfosporosinus sp.]